MRQELDQFTPQNKNGLFQNRFSASILSFQNSFMKGKKILSPKTIDFNGNFTYLEKMLAKEMDCNYINIIQKNQEPYSPQHLQEKLKRRSRRINKQFYLFLSIIKNFLQNGILIMLSFLQFDVVQHGAKIAQSKQHELLLRLVSGQSVQLSVSALQKKRLIVVQTALWLESIFHRTIREVLWQS